LVHRGPQAFADKSVRATLVDQLAEDGSAMFEIMLQVEHGPGYGSRFGTRQADYTDSAATGRSGDGDDGVVEIHEGNG